MQSLPLTLFAALVAVNFTTSPARALIDAAGDFLPTYVGAPAGDLDILEAAVFDFGTAFAFGSLHNGLVGTTEGATYVWGVDRGSGTDGLFAGAPPVGPGVTFDAVVLLRADGTGTVIAFNDGLPPTTTELIDSVFAIGDIITALVPVDLLPSRGFALPHYRFNLWTRAGDGNALIADLARDSGTFAAVPEPGTWALLIAGFGMVGAAARRRRPGVVAA